MARADQSEFDPVKVVFVSPELRWPARDGGSIRIHALLRHLSGAHDLTVIVATRRPLDQGDLERLRSYTQDIVVVHKPWSRLRAGTSWLKSLFSGKPFIAYRYTPSTLDEVIGSTVLTRGAGAVFLGMHYLAAAVEGVARPKVVDFHDVAYVLYDRFAKGPRWTFRRFHGRVQRSIVRRFEARIATEMDGCTVVSREDRGRLEAIAPTARIRVMENGVDVSAFDATTDVAEPTDLLFVGSLDYPPNTDAVSHLMMNIMPLIWQGAAGVTLRIVGRAPSDAMLGLQQDPRVSVIGNVPDIRPYFRAARIVIVPLRIGGGTRIKILEAGAARRAVVATAIGAEGLELEAGRDLVVAQSNEAFASEVLGLLANESRRKALGDALRAAVEKRYAWDSVLAQADSWLEAIQRLTVTGH